MPTRRAEISARVVVRDDTARGLGQAKSSINSFAKLAAATTSGVIGGQIVSQAAFAAVRRLREEVRQGFDFAIEQERLRLQLGYLVDDVRGAEDFIRRFSAETPFQLQEVARSYKTLATIIGGGTDEIEGHIRRFSDAFAIFGSGSAADMQRFSVHYARVVNALKNGNDDILESLNELRDNGFIKLRDEINRLAKAGDHDAALALLLRDLERAKGGADELAGTTAGLISTYEGLKVQLLGLAAEASLPAVNELMRSLNTELQEALDHFSGESLADDNWIVAVGESLRLAVGWLREFSAAVEVLEARLTAMRDLEYSPWQGVPWGPRRLGLQLQAGELAADEARRRIRDRRSGGDVFLAPPGGGRGGGGGLGGPGDVGGPTGTPGDPVEVRVAGLIPGIDWTSDDVVGAHQRLRGLARPGGEPMTLFGGPYPLVGLPPAGAGTGGELMAAANEIAEDARDTAHSDAMRLFSVSNQILGVLSSGASGGGLVGGILGAIAPFLPSPFNFIAGGVAASLSSGARLSARGGGGGARPGGGADAAPATYAGGGLTTVNLNTDDLAAHLGSRLSSAR